MRLLFLAALVLGIAVSGAQARDVGGGPLGETHGNVANTHPSSSTTTGRPPPHCTRHNSQYYGPCYGSFPLPTNTPGSNTSKCKPNGEGCQRQH
jgi:hypothetical protein